jgi:hypothetical protein
MDWAETSEHTLIAVQDDAKLIEYSDYLFTSVDNHQLFLACILKHATAIEYLFSMTGLSKRIRP